MKILNLEIYLLSAQDFIARDTVLDIVANSVIITAKDQGLFFANNSIYNVVPKLCTSGGIPIAVYEKLMVYHST